MSDAPTHTYSVASRVFDAGSPVGDFEARAADRIEESVSRCLGDIAEKLEGRPFDLVEVEISSIQIGDDDYVQVTVVGSPS